MRHTFVALLVPFIAMAAGCGSDDSGSSGVEGSGGASGSSAAKGGAGGVVIPQGGSSSGTAGTAGTMPDLDSEVNVIITADNAYGFGYGTGSTVVNYFGGVENPD